MDDLVSFLKARLDEDQQAIRIWEACCFHVEACDDTGGYLERFDEKRMLAEVEAKRKLLDLHPGDFPADPDGGYSWTEECQRCYEDTPCPTVRLLALPYAGHADYREEWRPAV